MLFKSKIFKNPILIGIVLTCFFCLTMASCARTIGQDKDGKPIRETSMVETLAGLILLGLLLAALAGSSTIHGSLDQTTVNIAPPDDTANQSLAQKRLFIDTLENAAGPKYKPIELYDEYGTQIGQFAATLDPVQPHDQITATISDEVLKKYPLANYKDWSKIKGNILVQLQVSSDFSMDTHNTGTIKVKKISIVQTIPQTQYHTVFTYNGTAVNIFVDVEKTTQS